MRNRIEVLILTLLGFLYVGHKIGQAAPAQPSCTPAANDPADSVDTANPYANDQDGCACVDPTNTATCYCLVGYASDGSGGCTATAVTVTDPGKCDPSADTASGDDRTCICSDLVGEPGTAYLDESTCYCKSGYTTLTGSTRSCTQVCPSSDGNCVNATGSSVACDGNGDTAGTCRCKAGYTPRYNSTGTPGINCLLAFCIQGEGPTGNHEFCVRDYFTTVQPYDSTTALGASDDPLYDPFFVTCSSGTGSRADQSYCGRDCTDTDWYCSNNDFTASCAAGDMDCRCQPGFGLKAILAVASKCVPIRCTLEDPNCICNNTYDRIDSCFCGYWTAPDRNNPGFCSSSCPLGEANCVRGDTKERCYTDYVGSAGCQCRNEADMTLYRPVSTNYSTTLTAFAAGTSTTVLFWENAVTCQDVTSFTPNNECFRGTPNCNCTVATVYASTCICDSHNGYTVNASNPGYCVLANKTCGVGQYPDLTEVCTDFACNDNDTLGTTYSDFCVLTSTLTSTLDNCTGTGGGSASLCSCMYGYYPDTNGKCSFHGNATTGYCDKRLAGGNCDCTSTTDISTCSCALGFYADFALNSNFSCLQDCGQNTDYCVLASNNSVNCSTDRTTANIGTCVCSYGYKVLFSGSAVTCTRVNCDFEFDNNCEKGVFIASNDYTNVHCGEGRNPGVLDIDVGHCIAGCTVNTTTNNVDHFCREGGSVDSPGTANCTSPPCFCALGYNPVFTNFNSDITCVKADCNPLVDPTGQCKCQFINGSVSYDMANCKCEPPYTSSSSNDGTCAFECTNGEDHCKVASTNITACSGTGCECRAGYASLYDSSTLKYQCIPYECDSSDQGCVCTHPGDIDTCSCSGTISVGTITPVSVSFVGNKYLFPGYCRPVECNPSSDPNCECIDSTLPDTCYCKPGYSIDLKFSEIQTDSTANLEVNTYFNTLCKPIDFRSSCPLRADVQEIPDHSTGCSCSWLDQHGTTPEKLCKCGIVVDDDCFLTACNNSLDIYSSQNDGPCDYETVTVDSVAHKYTVCRDGLKTDLNGGCVKECAWEINSPNACSETLETCGTGFFAHYDLLGNKNCYLVECVSGSTNCQCRDAITNLRGYDQRLCRCAPGYAPDGNGGCTEFCSVADSKCTRTCTGGTCCAYGYTPRTSWTRDETGSNVYTATVGCVQAACNQALDSTACVCQTDAYDEGLDMGQCACESGKLHDGEGNCVTPTVATCVSCSETGEASECYSTIISASDISASGVISAGTLGTFSLQTCSLDTTTLSKNYQSCQLQYIITNNDRTTMTVTRGCSSSTCSDSAQGVEVCTADSDTQQTCTMCCSSGSNCNIFALTLSGVDKLNCGTWNLMLIAMTVPIALSQLMTANV